MKTIRREHKLDDAEVARLIPSEIFAGADFATLDIETLGLSPVHSPCILIGIAHHAKAADGSTILIEEQFFAEEIRSGDDERAMLLAAEEALGDTPVAITYNGRSFDLPYIETRRRILGMPPQKARYNLDLYPLLRDYSDLPSFLPNMRQTTVESFAGLWDKRTDEISGKESVSLYYEYLLSKDEDTFAKILLHNSDDVLQLYRLISLMKRADVMKAFYGMGFPVHLGEKGFLTGEIRLLRDKLVCKGAAVGIGDYALYGDENPSLFIDEGAFSLTIPIERENGLVFIDCEDKKIDIPASKQKEGFLLLKVGDDIQHSNCNFLVKSVLESLLAQF